MLIADPLLLEGFDKLVRRELLIILSITKEKETN